MLLLNAWRRASPWRAADLLFVRQSVVECLEDPLRVLRQHRFECRLRDDEVVVLLDPVDHPTADVLRRNELGTA